jgi:hypothetical protein
MQHKLHTVRVKQNVNPYVNFNHFKNLACYTRMYSGSHNKNYGSGKMFLLRQLWSATLQ